MSEREKIKSFVFINKQSTTCEMFFALILMIGELSQVAFQCTVFTQVHFQKALLFLKI